MSSVVIDDSSSLGNVCVFCGASQGNQPVYMDKAKELGAAIAQHGYGLVYGSGTLGLMGQVAKTVHAHGGEVTGIIPNVLLEFEAPTKPIGSVIIVDSMHTRKRTMNHMSVAFIALPGGYGTIEELMEMVTWSQLGIHSKPIIVLNINNFYGSLLDWIRKSSDSGFIGEELVKTIKFCVTVEEVIDAIKTYQVPSGRFKLDWSST